MTASVDALLARWHAVPDGTPFATASSILVPAQRDGTAVMLKIATAAEEARGNRLMIWWDGRGSARVLEHEGDAILLERATGSRSLAEKAKIGGAADDAATGILCRTVNRLHAIADPPPSGLTTLTVWFRDLFDWADGLGGFHVRAAAIARELLAAQQEIVVLHGDVHHGNVLDFGTAAHAENDGWAAIDPKSLIGDRAFDFANILCNPNADVALRPGRLARQLEVVATAAALERTLLIRWTIAWAGLSSAWSAREGVASHAGEIGRAAERLLHEHRTA